MPADPPRAFGGGGNGLPCGSVLAVLGWSCPDVEELYGSVSDDHLTEQMCRLSPALPGSGDPGAGQKPLSDAELQARISSLTAELEERREEADRRRSS